MIGGMVEQALLIVLPVVAVFLVPTLWAIIDLIHRRPEQFPRFARTGASDKTGWIIALVVGWLIGLGWLVAIVYLIVVRRKMGPVQADTSAAPPGLPGQ